MNILYLGPYRYNNFFGSCSRDIIESLSKIDNLNVYNRNILLNNLYNNQTMISYSGKQTEKFPNEFDIIIEHCPLEMLSVDRSIGKKFIAMPIMDYGISNLIKDKLQDFDLVCVDDIHHKKILDSVDQPAVLLDYNISHKTDIKHKINLGLNNFKKKLYFIGSYAQNTSSINKLIVAFILAFRNVSDTCLLLLLNDANRDAVTKSVEKTISELYAKMNYSSIVPPIQTMVQPLSVEDLHIAHHTLDMFIDLNDEYDSGLNYNLAKKYGNPILSINDVDNVVVPYLDSFLYDTRYKHSVLTTNLKQKMIEKLEDVESYKSPQYAESKTIREIIESCF